MRHVNDGAEGGPGQGTPRDLSSPRVVLALLAALVLVCSWVSDGWAGERRADGTATPRLVVEVDEIDLGDLPKGSFGVGRFELRNDGDANLRIKSVKSGCACTVAEYDKVIRPGELGLVQATLFTETLNGEVGKGITLETNDPESPHVFLTLRARVVTAVRVLPDERIILRNDADSNRVRRVVRRTTDSGHGFFNITGLRATVPWLEVRARKVREGEPASSELPAVSTGDWVVEIGLAEQAPYGRERQEVEFNTGLNRQPQVKLVVLTEITAPIELPVERLFLLPGDSDAANSLAFTVREGLDPAALRVDAQPEGLDVELVPGEGRSVTAQVRWKGGDLEGGKLIFRIAGEEFEMPVVLAPAG